MIAPSAPGSIAISDTVRKFVEGYFTLKALGPARIKGVSEPVNVAFSGGNTAARAALQRIDWLFAEARIRQESGRGNRVWVEFSPDGSETFYRSELLDGRIALDDAALGWGWTAEILRAQITWTRRFFWEGPEVPCPRGYTFCWEAWGLRSGPVGGPVYPGFGDPLAAISWGFPWQPGRWAWLWRGKLVRDGSRPGAPCCWGP